MKQWQENFRKAPPTLWAFAALSLLWGVGSVMLVGGWTAWLTLILDGVFTALVLGRVRLAWMLLVVGAVMDIVRVLASSSHWWLATLDALLLVLLLAPQSRRFMSRASPQQHSV